MFLIRLEADFHGSGHGEVVDIRRKIIEGRRALELEFGIAQVHQTVPGVKTVKDRWDHHIVVPVYRCRAFRFIAKDDGVGIGSFFQGSAGDMHFTDNRDGEIYRTLNRCKSTRTDFADVVEALIGPYDTIPVENHPTIVINKDSIVRPILFYIKS
ncbi:hypothetical protein ES708_25865 [subsurface metagenome]